MLQSSSSLLSCVDASEALDKKLKQNSTDVSLDELSRAVENGDVFVAKPSFVMQLSDKTGKLEQLEIPADLKKRIDAVGILMHFMSIGNVKAVDICLRTVHPIDWNVQEPVKGNALLHWVCSITVPDELSVELLKRIMVRIESHPMDLINLETRDVFGVEFISCAAKVHRLSLFWPFISNQPYFSDCVDAIPVHLPVWQTDWSKLPLEAQKVLEPKTKCLQESDETAKLWLLFERLRAGVYSAALRDKIYSQMEAQVRAGANILFRYPGSTRPMLHDAMYRESPALLEILLKTPCRIDFTVECPYRQTPFHLMFSILCSEELLNIGSVEPSQTASPNTVTETHKDLSETMFRLVMNRLKARGFECKKSNQTGQHSSPRSEASKYRDLVDWSIIDNWGRDVPTCAAWYERLYLLFRVLKDYKLSLAAFFPNSSPTFRCTLAGPVNTRDWELLSDEDRRNFNEVPQYMLDTLPWVTKL